MKTTILIYCAMVCMAAGQWSTSVWPSYQHPRQSVAQFQDVHSAAVERCYAAGVSIAELRFYRSQYDNLTNIKARLKSAIPAYIVTNGMDGDLSGYIESNGIPFYTITGLLYSIKMPTNFLDYTPFSNLSGVGPLTNSGYAWGNGWTNAQTKAGGTNYPPGRTNWYTTDYGIMWITNIFPALVWVDAPASYSSTYRYGSITFENNQNFSEGKAGAESNFNFTAFNANIIPLQFTALSVAFYDTGGGGAGLYIADAQAVTSRIMPLVIGNITNMTFDADFYVLCGTNYISEYHSDFAWNGVETVFDDFGTPSVFTNTTRIYSGTNITYPEAVAFMGSTNMPSTWAADPITNLDFNTSVRGWGLDGSWIILKFDGTNGFKYR
jgi:hypothetical protein